MLKQSVSFKLLLLLLVLSLGLSMIAVAVTNGKTETGTEGTTSTGTEDSTTEPETEAVVDPTVIFSHQSDLAYYVGPVTSDSESYQFCVTNFPLLEAGKEYEISWNISMELMDLVPNVSIGYCLSNDLEVSDVVVLTDTVDFIWENSAIISVPDVVGDWEMMFYVAEGTYEDFEPFMGSESYNEKIVPGCVKFWLREKGD